MATILVYRNRVVDGMVELNENGSKEEKMSSIIIKYEVLRRGKLFVFTVILID